MEQHICIINERISTSHSSYQALLAAHDLIADEKLVKRRADIDEEFLDRIKTIRIDKDPNEPLVSIASGFYIIVISRP